MADKIRSKLWIINSIDKSDLIIYIIIKQLSAFLHGSLYSFD